MRLFDYESRWKEIEAVIPVYTENGANGTDIYLADADVVRLETRTDTVMKHIAAVFAVDIRQLKKKYGMIVGRKSSAPLPFHPDLVFISGKTRVPLSRNDGAKGFFSVDGIERIVCGDKGGTVAVLKSGRKIKLPEKDFSFRRAFMHGEVASREIRYSYARTCQGDILAVFEKMMYSTR